jgi:hypothetical protein
MKHLFGCHFKHQKNRNSIVTFQSGHLTEQTTPMYDPGSFELKMFASLHMKPCCLRAKIVNHISQNFNLCDFRPRDMQEYYMLFGIFKVRRKDKQVQMMMAGGPSRPVSDICLKLKHHLTTGGNQIKAHS